MRAKPWVILGVLLVLAVQAGADDDWQSEYKVGDLIEHKITDDLWQRGVVAENVPGQSLRVNLEEFVQGTYRRAGGIYIVYGKNDIRKRTAAPAAGKDASDGTRKPKDRTHAGAGPAEQAPAGLHDEEPWRNAYQVGDLIGLKITDEMWQNGIVVENSPGAMMTVELEEFVRGSYRRAGGAYLVYGKSDIRKRGEPPEGAREQGEPPAPETDAGKNPSAPTPDGEAQAESGAVCLAQHPEGEITPASVASAAVFQRLIYENHRDREIGRKVGISFVTFEIPEVYRNTVTEGVPRHMTAAPDTRIYRIKTDYHFCVEYTDAILKHTIIEGYWLCFKDKDGNWVAAPDGRRDWKQEHLPKK